MQTKETHPYLEFMEQLWKEIMEENQMRKVKLKKVECRVEEQ